MRHFITRIIAFFLLVCSVFSMPAYSATVKEKASFPIVRASVRDNFARVSFEWKEAVDFIADAKGKTVTITFDKKASPNIGVITANLAPYITRAVKKSDGSGIVLTLDNPYKTRTFTNDNISGIDFLGIDPNAKKEWAKKEAAKKELEKQKLALKKKEQEKLTQADKLAKLANLAPAAGGDVTTQKPAEKPPEPPAEKAPEPTPASPTEKPSPTLAPTAAPDTQSKAAPAATPAPAVAEESDGNAKPSSIVPAAEKMNKVHISTADDSATIRFPLAERTSFAVFTRNHYLWIVIGKPLTLDMSDFTDMEKTVIGKPELIAHQKATILYIPMDDNVYASVKKEDNSNNWAVLLTQKKSAIAAPISVEISTAPPAPPHIFLSTLEMTEPIMVRDPLIGDKLIITTLFKTGEAVQNARDFIEFSLLESTQGIVVAQKSDDVAIMQMRNGLRVTAGKGASISPNLPKLEVKTISDGLQANPTIFPYNLWKIDTSKSRRKELRDLFHKIVETENIQDANNARLRMAQIYLSDGMSAEAIAFLDGINRTNPSFYRTAKLAGLRGAANFLMSRFIDAAKDFSAAELNNNKEMDYWRAVLSDLLGNSGQTYDYLGMNEDYISKYPPVFRQKLAIVAADRAIAAKEYNVALQIFDALHKENLLDSINVYINFLMAKISLSTGQEKDGLEALEKLADDDKHPFVRARAEFTLIAREMDAGMDKDEAIDRLERLRLAWHGDGLELQILTILGELYNERKDYVNAMRVWNNGVQGFKNTAAAIDMARKMAETFIIMFNNDEITSNLSPLEALALYYEYRTYMPSGTAGNEMIDRLAEKLIGVDLLDQASSLLDHQMRVQSEKEPRSRIGAKLATIYLLNHQPQKALNALQDSVYGENSVLLRLLRNRITAECMVDMEKFDLALQTLGNDDDVEAEKIRASIYWKTKDWQNMAARIENILKNRPDITAPITVEESEFLIKLALSYAFQDNKEQMQYLRDYFAPLMANNPNKKVFDFVTSQDIEPNSRNFDSVIASLVNTRSFIENYRARIKTADAPKEIKKPAPKKIAAKKAEPEKTEEKTAEKSADKKPDESKTEKPTEKPPEKPVEKPKEEAKKPDAPKP